MIYKLRLRLTSPMLGARRDHGIRRFDRQNRAGNLWLDMPPDLWRWAIREAVSGLWLKDVDPLCVQCPNGFLSPALVKYDRQFFKGGKKKTELFECIRSNTVITIRFAVTDRDPGKPQDVSSRGPNEAELQQIFKYVGRFLGISPWGQSMRYGRFEVDDLGVETNPNDLQGSLDDVCYESDSDMRHISDEEEDSVFTTAVERPDSSIS